MANCMEEIIIDSDGRSVLLQGSFPHISYDCYNNYAYNNRAAETHVWSRIKNVAQKRHIPRPNAISTNQPVQME